MYIFVLVICLVSVVVVVRNIRPANDCVLDFFSSLVFYDDTVEVYGFSSYTIDCNVRETGT